MKPEKNIPELASEKFIVDGKEFIFENLPAENIHQQQFLDADEDNGITQIKEASELGDSLRELNKDDIEKSRMSGIDMRARLHYIEVSSILAVDSLVAFKFLPVPCLAFTRQKKRLSVSLQGRGRQEIVDIVGGKKEQDAKVAGMNMGDRFKSTFGMGAKKDAQ